ncbi:MAG: right-handed parallel beta-helix repeat-containing protein [Bacteroidales bacterium]|jgi:hypothetical protein|nr:right-handed parallel beta-helix repeat-containing protein [Bacteroidales bacterium]
MIRIFVFFFFTVFGAVFVYSGCSGAETPDTPPAAGDTIAPPAPDEPQKGAILYPYPDDAPASDRYAVTLNSLPCYVYPVPETTKRQDGVKDFYYPHVANFDIEGEVRVAITPSVAVTSVKIRPESAAIAHVVTDNRIEFTLARPQFLSIEINGDIERPLLLFANAPETDIPDRNDPGVIWFEGGKIHTRTLLSVGSGKTVYLAPGAIVRSAFRVAAGSSNVRIAGRGILTGELLSGEQHRMIEVNNATDVLVEGITVTDCKHWTIALMGCSGVTVRGVKIVSNTGWDDGVDVVSSRNVTVDGCFIHTKDDCVAIKAGVKYFGYQTHASVENVTVKNCVIWNGKHGNGLEIGFETSADTIRNIVFENIDLIHVENPTQMNEGVFTIHNGDRAVVTNILYRNIRVEDFRRYLIGFWVLESQYSQDPVRGKISGVRMENISVTSSREGDRISSLIGYSAASNISNVHISNFTINGERITSLARLIQWQSHTSNITLE